MQKTSIKWLPAALLGAAFLALLGGCGGGPRVELDPESAEFFDKVRLIMSGEEKEIFEHQPDVESRREFIEDFWAKRDPDPDTEENEFKQEYYDRIDYANQRFNEGTPGWKTDRGRIYIYLGQPDKRDEIHTHNEPGFRGPILWWVYYRYGFAVKFIDRNYTGQFKIAVFDDPYGGMYGNFFDAVEMAKFGLIREGDGAIKKIADFDLDYDADKAEFVLRVPIQDLEFVAEEGKLRAEFEFSFFIYPKEGTEKFRFKENRTFEMEEKKAARLDDMTFTFSYELTPGRYYVDVVMFGKPDLGKSRKIFEINR